MAEKYGGVPGSPGGGTSDNESGGGYSGAGGGAGAREQDHLLPIANVSRIMKKGLPANAKISKEAKETVQECVSEFISFITGEASDKCQREKRKTVNGDDLLWAMTTLGFEDYIEPLRIYLHRYREMEGERTASAMPKDNSSVNGMPSANGHHMAAASAFAAPFHTSAYHQVMQQQQQQQQQSPYMARNPGLAYGQYQMLAPPYQMPMGENPPFSSKGDR